MNKTSHIAITSLAKILSYAKDLIALQILGASALHDDFLYQIVYLLLPLNLIAGSIQTYLVKSVLKYKISQDNTIKEAHTLSLILLFVWLVFLIFLQTPMQIVLVAFALHIVYHFHYILQGILQINNQLTALFAMPIISPIVLIILFQIINPNLTSILAIYAFAIAIEVITIRAIAKVNLNCLEFAIPRRQFNVAIINLVLINFVPSLVVFVERNILQNFQSGFTTLFVYSMKIPMAVASILTIVFSTIIFRTALISGTPKLKELLKTLFFISLIMSIFLLTSDLLAEYFYAIRVNDSNLLKIVKDLQHLLFYYSFLFIILNIAWKIILATIPDYKLIFISFVGVISQLSLMIFNQDSVLNFAYYGYVIGSLAITVWYCFVIWKNGNGAS